MLAQWSGWLISLAWWEHSSPWIKYKFTIVTLLWKEIDVTLTLMLPSPQCFILPHFSSSTILVIVQEAYLLSTMLVIVHKNGYCPQCLLPWWTILCFLCPFNASMNLQTIFSLVFANNTTATDGSAGISKQQWATEWIILPQQANSAET